MNIWIYQNVEDHLTLMLSTIINMVFLKINLSPNNTEKPCARVVPRRKGETRDMVTPLQRTKTCEFWEIPPTPPPPPRWRLEDIDWDQFRTPTMRRGGSGTPTILPPPPGHHLRSCNSRGPRRSGTNLGKLDRVMKKALVYMPNAYPD